MHCLEYGCDPSYGLFRAYALYRTALAQYALQFCFEPIA